jgi:hypothetical protein
MLKILSQMTLLKIIKMDKIVLQVKMVAMLLLEVGTRHLSSICRHLDNLLQLGEEDKRWTTSWMTARSQSLQLITELPLTTSITQ